MTLGGKSVAQQFNLEFRAMDATASPHLAMAALLIAGRLGIEQRLALNAITNEIPDSLNDEQRQARGIVALPASLAQALDCLRNSGAFTAWLPKPLLDTYYALKTEELALTEQLSPADLCEHYARLY